MTISDNEWQWVVQRVITSGTTSDYEWQQVTTSNKKWQWVTTEWQRVIKQMKANKSK